MALDPVVTRRFRELAEKADAVIKKKEFAFTATDSRKQYFRIPSAPFKEWGTNVLNLLQRTFGEQSVQYRQFVTNYNNFREWESEFEDCRSIFVAAREDYDGGYLF